MNKNSSKIKKISAILLVSIAPFLAGTPNLLAANHRPPAGKPAPTTPVRPVGVPASPSSTPQKAVAGNYELIQRVSGARIAELIRQGADVNFVVNGESALIWQIRLKNKEGVIALVNGRANVNMANRNGESPMYIAIRQAGCVKEIVECLQKAGAKLSKKDASELAFAQYSPISFKDLISLGLDVNAVDGNGNAILVNKILANNYDAVEALLNAGAKTNIVDSKGRSLLAIALDSQGRNLDAPCQIAATLRKKNLKLSKQEFQKFKDELFSKKLRPERVKLIKFGVGLESKNAAGETALIAQIRNNNYRAVDELLNAGAKVDVKSAQGNSTLFIAIEETNWNTTKRLRDAGVKLLEDEGAEISKKIIAGELKTEKEIGLKDLIELGADVNAVDDKGNSLLTAKIQTASEKDVKQLIKAGANIDAKDAQGRSALYLAVCLKDSKDRKNESALGEIIKELKKAGAKLQANEATDLLVKSIQNKKTDYFSYKELVDMGANVNAGTADGHSLLLLSKRIAEADNDSLYVLLKSKGAKYLDSEKDEMFKFESNRTRVIAKNFFSAPATKATPETLQKFIKNNAEFANVRTQKDLSMYTIAIIWAGTAKMSDVTLGMDDCDSTRELAAFVKNIDVWTKVLSEAKITINEKDKKVLQELKKRIFLSAVATGSWTVLEELTKSGLDLDTTDSDGNNAFHMLAFYRPGGQRLFSQVVMKPFIKNLGDDAEEGESLANAFLRYLTGVNFSVTRKIDPTLFPTLKKAGLDIEKPNAQGLSPLALSICTSNSMTVLSLIRNGASPFASITTVETGAFGKTKKKTKLIDLAIEVHNEYVEKAKANINFGIDYSASVEEAFEVYEIMKKATDIRNIFR